MLKLWLFECSAQLKDKQGNHERVNQVLWSMLNTTFDIYVCEVEAYCSVQIQEDIATCAFNLLSSYLIIVSTIIIMGVYKNCTNKLTTIYNFKNYFKDESNIFAFISCECIEGTLTTVSMHKVYILGIRLRLNIHIAIY